MKKVLVIANCGMGYEGITTVILNYCENMDRSGISLDFVAPGHIPEGIEARIKAIGTAYEFPKRQKFLKDYMCELYQLIKKNRYDVVHINGNSGTMAIEAGIAKVCHVSQIIVHGHSTACNHPILNHFMVPIMKRYATKRLACSAAAGKWLYGKSTYTILNNAVDLKKFKFDPLERASCREKLGIKDDFVIGHIGHFTETKNQRFLIDVFEKIHEVKPETSLMLVSDGPKFEEMKNIVKEKGLEKKVFFLGRCADTAQLYQAMDLFAFPSKWEGLGLVLVEAQASGLPCLVSASVPQTASTGNNVDFLSLEQKDVWVEKIRTRITQMQYNRQKESTKNVNHLQAMGFDIRLQAIELKKIYLEQAD